MTLILHPRQSRAGNARVWVGLSGVTSAPELQWRLKKEGAEQILSTTPAAVRPLSSVRSHDLLEGSPPRVFAGIYEFSGLEPGVAYQVELDCAGQIARCLVRTLPEQVPPGPERWLNILLVSCFHYVEATPFAIEQALERAERECRDATGATFHLSLLLGDQVYLDLPTLKDFRKDSRWLAQKFEDDYRRNWFGEKVKARAGTSLVEYARVLSAAPSVCIPDDHEYWNNFPHASPFIENSWQFEDRQSWRTAAQAVFEGFQLHHPGLLGEPLVVNVPPLSILVLDSRSFRGLEYQRTNNRNAAQFANCLKPGALETLRAWVDDLNAQDRFGVFVTGQTMLEETRTGLERSLADAAVANYGDYAEMMTLLRRVKNPLILITGDVHWGRLLQILKLAPYAHVGGYEIITSPVSLVTTVFNDDLGRAWGAVKKLFGSRDPWWRHADPRPARLDEPMRAGGWNVLCKHRQKGDQFAVLSLQQQGAGANARLKARLRYYPIHPDSTVQRDFYREYVFDLLKPF